MQAAWQEPQHDDWLMASAALRRVAVRLSGRTDLALRVHPGLPVPACGRFLGRRAEILLDAQRVLDTSRDTPAAIAASFPSGLVPASTAQAHAALVAALTFQAAHAAHTRTDPDGVVEQLRRWLEPLEGARVARAHTDRRPEDRQALRTALSLLLGVDDDSTSAAWLVRAVTVRAWAAAGVLGEGESASAVHRMRLRVGLDIDEQVAEVIGRAVAADDDDTACLRTAADLLGRLLDRPQPGESGSATGDPTTDRLVPPAPAEPGGRPSLHGRGPIPRGFTGQEGRELAKAERENARAAAGRANAIPVSSETTTHEPGVELRRATRLATDNLRRALSTVHTRADVASSTPPGRMVMPELMRRQAQVSAHAPLTARPWRQLRRGTVAPPRVSVGLSLDGSRSHLPIHHAMSELVWLLATASRNAAAEVAAVTWNSRVSVLVRPGYAPKHVLEPRCHGSSTGCPESLRALTGLLGLTSHDGIRIVVVASDGRLPNRAATADEVRSLVESGVAVAWVSQKAGGWCPPFATPIVADPANVVRSIAAVVARSAQGWIQSAAPPSAAPQGAVMA